MAVRTGSEAFPAPDHNHEFCVTDALQRAAALCARRRVRLTDLRRRVLELVWESHAPVGAYDILARLNAGGRRTAPIVVYRVLGFLMRLGLVHRLASRNAYIGCDSPDAPHGGHFLICNGCGAVVELRDRRIDSAIVRGAERAGFAVKAPIVEVQGVCPDCRSRGGHDAEASGR